MKQFGRSLIFILLTPAFFILSLWVSVFPHEFAHSTAAWLYGYKLSPTDISYGAFNWQNVLFVDGIDEHVNYFLIYLLGDKPAMGMIAFAGPFIATVLLYFFSLYLLRLQAIKSRPYLFYFVLWVNAMNLSELISYATLRSFSRHGDVGHVIFAWDLSPWLIFVVGSFLLAIASWNFFSRTLIELYARSRSSSTLLRCFFLILFCCIMFGYPGARVLLESNSSFSNNLSILFCVITPVIAIICWPTREWVKKREALFAS